MWLSADAIARRRVAHVDAFLGHMTEVLEQVTGDPSVECWVQSACQVVTNAVGPSSFEGLDRRQPTSGRSDEAGPPLYGSQDVSLVELPAEGEVKVMVGRSPVSRGDVFRGEVEPGL